MNGSTFTSPSTKRPGYVALATSTADPGVSYLTPTEARALAVELEQAAYDAEQAQAAKEKP